MDLHNPNRWELSVTDASDSDVSELISNAHQVGPTKENLFDILANFQQHHLQFKAEFKACLTEIRRSLLNIALPVVNDDLKSIVNAKSVTAKSPDASVEKKCKKKSDTHKSKPIITALPDLMDDSSINESDSSGSVERFKRPISDTTGRARPMKTELSRPVPVVTSSTTAGEPDFSHIKSPWARQILKRRVSVCEVPRPDPLPSGARPMTLKKRRVSHAATHASHLSDLSTKSLKEEATSPVRAADRSFGFNDDNADSETSQNDDTGDSNQTVKCGNSPIPIAELAKMYLPALQERIKAAAKQTAKPMKDDDSDDADVLFPCDSLYF